MLDHLFAAQEVDKWTKGGPFEQKQPGYIRDRIKRMTDPQSIDHGIGRDGNTGAKGKNDWLGVVSPRKSVGETQQNDAAACENDSGYRKPWQEFTRNQCTNTSNQKRGYAA